MLTIKRLFVLLASYILILSSSHAGAKPTNKIDPKLKELLFAPVGVAMTADKKLSTKFCSLLADVQKQLDSHAKFFKCYNKSQADSFNFSTRHAFKFTATKKSEKKITLAIEYLDGDDLDFSKVSVDYDLSNKEVATKALTKLTKNLLEYKNKNQILKRALLFYTARPGTVRFSEFQSTISYVEKDELGGVSVSSEEMALAGLSHADPVRANFVRANLEISIFLGAGAVGYLIFKDQMKGDFDFDNNSIKDFSRRLFTTEQWKFDDNSIFLNWGHVYAGVSYHQVARMNGFSSYESFLITLASSSIWEYFIEYREVVSINDQIMTGVGGSILGEVMYQISDMLSRRVKSPLGKILAAYFRPVGLVDKFFDSKNIAMGKKRFNSLGLKRDNYEKFDIVTGIKRVEQSNGNSFTLAEVGLAAEMINLPMATEGKVNKLVMDTVAVELVQKMGLSEEGVRDYYSFAKVIVAGYFSKNIGKDAKGRKQGYTMIVGPAMATEYKSSGVKHADDFYAVVNVVGASLDVTFFAANQKFRFAFDVYGDFAFVRPYKTNEYLENGNGFEGSKSTLSKENYYVSKGVSLRAKSIYHPTEYFGMGVEAVQHDFTSLDEGERDRHAENVNRNLDLNDNASSVKVWVSYRISQRARINASIESNFRTGSISEYFADETATIDTLSTGMDTRMGASFIYDLI